MARDIYEQEYAVDGPAIGGFAVVADGTPFATITRALWVANGGNVDVEYQDGTRDTIFNVPDSTRLDIRVRRVFPDNTTATNISAWY